MTSSCFFGHTRNGFIAAALVGLAACGGASTTTTDATPTPQTPQQAAQTVAQAGQQAAQAMQQAAAQNQNATAVDFEKLVELIPEVSGWTRSKPRGQQVSMGVSVSNAKARYEKGDSSIDLEITDTSFSQLVLAPWTMMMGLGWAERSSDGYRKAQAVNGQPGFESWENEPKNGEVTVLVANRFLVNAKGRSVDNIEAVRAVVQAVDFSKLAALK